MSDITPNGFGACFVGGWERGNDENMYCYYPEILLISFPVQRVEEQRGDPCPVVTSKKGVSCSLRRFEKSPLESYWSVKTQVALVWSQRDEVSNT